RNKEGLVHEVLQAHLDDIRTGTAPVKYEIQSWADLERWFNGHLELQERFRMTRGCPFGTIGNEVTENDELIRQALNLIFEVVKRKLVAFFAREKARGAVLLDADEDALADFCIAAVQGAMLMGKIKRQRQTVEATIEQALNHVRRFAAPSRRLATPDRLSAIRSGHRRAKPSSG